MEHQPAQGGMRLKSSDTDGFMALDCGAGSPISEDLLCLSGLLNFDGLNESSSPLSPDMLFSFFNSSLHPIFENSASSVSPSGLEQARNSVLEDEGTSGDGVSRPREKLAAQKPNLQSEFSMNLARECELESIQKDVKGNSNIILKSIGNFTFSDRMLKALSLLKDSSGGGILAQVWMPVKQGDNYILSTSEQPFLLDHVLAGYREVSRVFTFSAKETPGMFPGVPGRVFISGLPEWTSNVLYYNKFEYLRVEHAISHDVRGSLAVPVFDPHQSKCRAVLELVTMKEKSNFDVEMENVCRALQAVDLRTTKVRAHCQNLTKEQRSALSEILDVLRAVCHAHMLPLALTWMPVAYDSGIIDDVSGIASISKTKKYRKEIMLCIQELASYVNDSQMHGFLQACSEYHLAKGQGIAGKALLSNHPYFSPDVKAYDIGDYPLAHHARKFGLQAAVAIRLRSTYTRDDDFILEFFLPVNCKGSAEQQLLLNNLSVTMQRICKSLRTVLDSDVTRPDVSEVDTESVKLTNSLSSEITGRYSQPVSERKLQMSEMNMEVADVPSQDQSMQSDEQVKYGLQKQTDKKRSTSEKHISLNVLQKYFAGSLKDAAKSLGVCPTTLKRICRQHGISRWPSRKIKKVNHSLKKIQSVINSVQGVEGTLQYDPKTGCLVAAVTPEKLSGDLPFSSTPQCGDRQFDEKLEGQRANVVSKLNLPKSHHSLTNEVPVFPNDCSTKSKVTFSNVEISRHTDIKGSLCSEDINLIARDGCIQDPTDNRGLQNFVPMSAASVAEEDEMDVKIDLNVGRELSHSSFSSMTDSSSESTSCCPTFKKNSKHESFVSYKGAVYTVKATYKSDTVRFKLLPSMGCLHLYEEVGKRFKLSIGTFQLKYMDDEEEWVLLTTDSDLQECIEVLESIASQSMKLQVRDVPCTVSAQPAVATCQWNH